MEPNIQRNELENCLFSQSTLSILVSVLPQTEADEYIRQMSSKGLDWKNPAGFETFAFFRAICLMERDALEASKHLDHGVPRKSQSNRINHVEAISSSSESKDEPQSHTPSMTQSQVNVAVASAAQVKVPAFDPCLKFPCPLPGHNHELNLCATYFGMNPRSRRDAIPEDLFAIPV